MAVHPRIPAATLLLLAALAPAAMADVMRSPIAIAVGASRVFVADFEGDRIHVLTRGGEAVADWGTSGSGPGGLLGPAGVAVAPDGSVLVADLYNHRVQRFGPDGTMRAAWSLGEAAQPFGIAVDARGRVYVTDLDAGRVTVWSSEGGLLAGWGTRGSARGQLLEPWGIVVDGQGDVWVADHGNHRIQHFSGAGECLDAWGEAGTGEAQLLGPMGLAIGRDGSIVVTDLVGGRVRSFTRSGELIARFGPAGVTTPGPATGIAIDEGGDLLLVDPSLARVERVAASPIAAGTSVPTTFALLPIAQPMGGGAVTLELAIPASGTVAAEIFSLDGRRVHTVPSMGCNAGVLRMTWDARTDAGRSAPTGMYFVRVHFEDGARRTTRTGRVLVLR